MESKELIEMFSKFKKQYEKDKFGIEFEEFDQYFYAEPYFLNRSTPYLEKNFYVNCLQMVAETLKNILHDLEYYVNLRGNTPLMQADLEVLKDKNKEFMKLYYTMHSLYKKHSNFYFTHTDNSPIVIEFVTEVMKPIEEYYSLMREIVPKLSENLKVKAKELDKKEKKKEFESSAYN